MFSKRQKAAIESRVKYCDAVRWIIQPEVTKHLARLVYRQKLTGYSNKTLWRRLFLEQDLRRRRNA